MLEEIYQRAQSILVEFDIQVIDVVESPADHHPNLVMLKRGRNRGLFAIYGDEILTDPRLRDVMVHNSHPLLLLSESVNDATAKICRELGINYIDVLGNLWLEFDEVFINVRKGRASKETTRTSSPRLSQNLFSKKRAQVIFALLTWPEITQWPVRDIAEVAGVSVGQVQTTLKDLDYQGYLMRGDSQLEKASELFQLWVVSYPTGLMPSLRIDDFLGDPKTFDLRYEQALVSGEAAVPAGLNPASLLVYVENLDINMVIRNRWTRSDRPNIFVRKRFWSHPSSIRPLRASPDVNPDVSFAPATLIYADLMASDDARQREVADFLKGRDERLFELTAG